MVCNSVFDGNIISKGCLTKLENYGNSLGCGVLTRNPWEANSKGWRGLKQKCSPSGGGGAGGGYGYFLEQHKAYLSSIVDVASF